MSSKAQYAVVATSSAVIFSVLKWNLAITEWVVSQSHKQGSRDILLGFLAQWMTVIIGLIFVACVLKKQQRMELVAHTGIALGTGFFVSQVIQKTFKIVRPFEFLQIQPVVPHVADSAFPSDHSIIAAVLACAVYKINKRLGIFCFILAVIEGISRVFCGLHWMRDILIGLLFGVSCFITAGYFQLGAKLVQPGPGIYYLTVMGRIFSVISILYHHNQQFESTLKFIVPTIVCYLLILIIVHQNWTSLVLSNPRSNEQQRKKKRFVWIQILIDVSFITIFYAFTQKMDSIFFAFYGTCIITSLLLESAEHCALVLFVSLVGLTTGLMLAYQNQPAPRVSLVTFNLQEFVGMLLLPRAFALFATATVVAWQINREQHLRSSGEFLESLVQKVPHYIYRINLGKSYTYANVNFCNSLGLTYLQIVGKTAFDLYPSDLASQYSADDESVLKTGEAISKDEPHQLNEQRVTVHVIKTPLFEGSRVVGLQGIFWDITATKSHEFNLLATNHRLANDVNMIKSELSHSFSKLRDNELVYSDIFENAGDVIYSHDLEGKFLSLNKAGEKLTGFTRFEFCEKHLIDIVTTKFQNLVNDKLREKLNMSESSAKATSYELEVVTKTGDIVPLEITSRVLYSGGRASFVHGIARSMIHRRAHEQFLIESIKEKENLLNEVHHRCRNNLQILVGLVTEANIAVKSYENASSAGDKCLMELEKRLRVMELLHDHLYRSANKSEVNMAKYIDRLAKWSSTLYLGLQDRIVVVLEVEGISLPIETANSIGIITYELLSNSFKHAFVGRSGGIVTISLFRQNNDRICLNIKDNGIGSKAPFAAHSGLKYLEAMVHRVGGSIAYKSDEGMNVNIVVRQKI